MAKIISRFSINEKKQKVKQYLETEKSIRNMAEELGIAKRTFQDWIDRYRHQIEYNIKDDHSLKGVSTYRSWKDEEGNTHAEWVKTDVKVDRAKQAISLAVEALNDDIPRLEPIKKPKHTLKNLASCYILTDYHMGMLAWADEAGDDWDTNIAYRTLISYFGAAIEQSPASHTGILCQLGDFLHYDSLDAVTPMGKNVLDADTRYPLLVNTSIKALRAVIDMMLHKHKNVHVVMAEGNHDLASSVWLRSVFAALYENEPRVTVDNTHFPYYSYEWGNTSLFFHHGHKKNLKQLSKTFVGLYDDLWGRTKYRYGHTGHFHHEKTIEDSLMKITQHPTLAAKDAYAARGGWLSKREASVVTYSKLHGKVSEIIITPEMLK